jgi:DNA-binding transcriptional regulator GbsR (MarR family)
LKNAEVHENEQSEKLRKAQMAFVQEWGRMSSRWGINRTMAQIHALLFITGKAMTAQEIIDTLEISRGNASMNLRDLTDWGVIRKFRAPGSRCDLFQSEPDAWAMFVRVIRERKRREIDPTIDAMRECRAMVPDSSDPETQLTVERLDSLLEIFGVLDQVVSVLFRSDQAFRETAEVYVQKK